jgi:hypothetical protein
VGRGSSRPPETAVFAEERRSPPALSLLVRGEHPVGACPGARSSCIPSIWRARPRPLVAGQRVGRGPRCACASGASVGASCETTLDWCMAAVCAHRLAATIPGGVRGQPRGAAGLPIRVGAGVREAGVSRSSRSGGGWCWHACDARQRWSHRPPARSGRGAPRLRCRRRPSPFRRPRAWTAGP